MFMPEGDKREGGNLKSRFMISLLVSIRSTPDQEITIV